MELNQKKKQMAQDLTIAKNDAAIMLQTHGINPGTKKLDDGERVQSAQKSQGAEGGNFFQKKKENLEDKARIMELIQELEENNQHIYIHKLEIRSLKDQVLKLLEERNYNSDAQLMGNMQMMNAADQQQSQEVAHSRPISRGISGSLQHA